MMLAQRLSTIFKASISRSNNRHFATSATASIYQPSIDEIKKLRAASEAPIGDCKKALLASEGDFPGAFEWLRKKGIASAIAKAGRSTAEGLIGVRVFGNKGSIVEVNSETDFVAMNEHFQKLVQQLAGVLFEKKSTLEMSEFNNDSLMCLQMQNNEEEKLVSNYIPDLIGKMGENISLRRGCTYDLNNGIVCSYVHNAVSPGLGKAASIVGLEYNVEASSEEAKKDISSFGHRLAMHIVASKPKFLKREMVPTEMLERESAFLHEQAMQTGKPEAIIKKMVEGKLNKFYNEIVLMDQNHLIEESNPVVSKVLNALNKKYKNELNLQIKGYTRYQIGEEEL